MTELGRNLRESRAEIVKSFFIRSPIQTTLIPPIKNEQYRIRQQIRIPSSQSRMRLQTDYSIEKYGGHRVTGQICLYLIKPPVESIVEWRWFMQRRMSWGFRNFNHL